MGRRPRRMHLSRGRTAYLLRRIQDKQRRRRVATAFYEIFLSTMLRDGRVNAPTVAMEVLSHYRSRDAGVGFSEALEHHQQVPYDNPAEVCIVPRYVCEIIADAWARYRDGESQTLNESFSIDLPAKRSPRRALQDAYTRLYLAHMILDHLTVNSARGKPLSVAKAIEWAEQELRDEPIEASENTLWEAWRAAGPLLEDRLRHNGSGVVTEYTPYWMPNWTD